MEEKKPTIDDVSRLANVSKATVSRYINGKYEYMSNDTKLKIEKIIEEINYRPSIIARSLKSKKTGLIGMIVGDITNHFSSILVKGVNDVCVKAGYQVIVGTTDDDPKKEADLIESMLERQVEGIIINTSTNSDKKIKKIIKQGVPIVLADRTIEGLNIDWVTTDNKKSVENLLELLFEKGYTKVGFFSEEIKKSNVRIVRHNSFVENGKKFHNDPSQLVFEIKKGDNYKEKLMDFYNKFPDDKKAIVTVNGVVMLGVLESLKELNLKIPEDIGICGYDDWGWTGLIGEGITVINLPAYDLGTNTGEILISRIEKKIKNLDPIHIELESKLIVRGSV